MSQLERTNPRGRLDVLVFRLVERFAERQCPREWEIVKPFVAQWSKKNLGPRRKRKEAR